MSEGWNLIRQVKIWTIAMKINKTTKLESLASWMIKQLIGVRIQNGGVAHKNMNIYPFQRSQNELGETSPKLLLKF
jgi:hypothetical protein